MMPCVDDYVYDDPTLAKNSSAESFGFGAIVNEKEKVGATSSTQTSPSADDKVSQQMKAKEQYEAEDDAEKLDLDKVLAHVYNPMKQGGIKGMEKGSLAHIRFKYVSPFKRAAKPMKKRLNVNALSFDPTKLNPNATEFNPLNPEVEAFSPS